MDPLRCPKCTFKYNTTEKEPLVLPCTHTFCALCVKKIDNTCPTCQEDFSKSKIRKNFVVRTLLDELSIKVQVETNENCETHKDELDRYCKSCWLLMCSKCKCPHVGNAQHIMSSKNLREEAQHISKSYRSVEKTKEDFSRRIDDHIDGNAQEIQKIQEYDSDLIKHYAEEELERAKVETEIAIRRIEEDARQKIQEIEAKKLKLISKANEAIKLKIEEIHSKAALLVESLEINNKTLLDAMRNISKDLKRKMNNFQDLDKLENDTLEECAKIFQLEGLQKTPLQQFIALSQSDVESLLSLKRLKFGEVIDCLNTTNQWVEATVLNVQAGQARVQYIENLLPKEEWIGINSSRILKKWTKGYEFQLNNRVDVFLGFNRWREGRIIGISPNQVEVYYTDAEGERKEWVDKDSYRLAEVGTKATRVNLSNSGFVSAR